MLAWIVENTLVAGLLAVGIVGLGRLVRLSPALRHALWLIVLVRLCAPPIGLVHLPESLGPRAAWGWIQSQRAEYVTASVEPGPSMTAVPMGDAVQVAPPEVARNPIDI